MRREDELVKSQFFGGWEGLRFAKLQYKFRKPRKRAESDQRRSSILNHPPPLPPANSESRIADNVINFRFPGIVSRLIHENAGRSRYVGDVLLDITGRQVVRATALRHPCSCLVEFNHDGYSVPTETNYCADVSAHIHTRGIQLFESDRVYAYPRITEIRFCEYPYGAIVARKQHEHGIFRTYSPPFIISR